VARSTQNPSEAPRSEAAFKEGNSLFEEGLRVQRAWLAAVVANDNRGAI